MKKQIEVKGKNGIFKGEIQIELFAGMGEKHIELSGKRNIISYYNFHSIKFFHNNSEIHTNYFEDINTLTHLAAKLEDEARFFLVQKANATLPEQIEGELKSLGYE